MLANQSDSDGLLTEYDDQVLSLRLSRPDVRNALSLDLLRALATALRSEQARLASAVVLVGEGSVFSAGADFRDLTGTASDTQFDDAVADVVDAIRSCPCPVVAVINGPCVGAACDVVLACDVRFASLRTYFQIPATDLGILYSPEAVRRWHGAVRPDALRRLLLLGERLDATAALGAGFIAAILDEEVAIDRIRALLGNQAVHARAAREATKGLLNELDDGDYSDTQWQVIRMSLLEEPARKELIRSRNGTATRPDSAGGTHA